MLKTMGFPSRYVQGPGALAQTGQMLHELGFRQPAILCDDNIHEIVLPRLAESFRNQRLPVNITRFPGEICRETVTVCNAEILKFSPDVVVGLGGGKAIDAAKAAAENAGVPIIVAPTAASNDAPTSRLIVINDAEHRPIEIRFLKLNPLVVLVDTEVIVRAPPRLFAAGIGDAISKNLEAHQCAAAGGTNFFGTPPLHTALMLADKCSDLIMRHGVEAYRSVRAQRVGPEVETVVEATVLLSGLGFENGGLSLAHSMIRGITAIPSMRQQMHGEMVAFGAFVQMVTEERAQAEIDQLLSVLDAVGLPVTFEALGHTGALSDAELRLMVDATLGHAYARNMVPALTKEHLSHALLKANELGSLTRQPV